jgi:molybdopterin/thiamine biosynthesis adenylyltransferase
VDLDQLESSDKILEQFGRQILVPGIDEEGQVTLSKRKICIIGLGALGTIASQYLVRSGIGQISLIDPDKI